MMITATATITALMMIAETATTEIVIAPATIALATNGHHT
jgi:hypothetical protein